MADVPETPARRTREFFLGEGTFPQPEATENLLVNIDMIRKMSIMGSAVRGDIQFAMIAAKDIAVYAAERLVKRDFTGKSVVDLLGQRDLSLNEAAAIIGAEYTALKLEDNTVNPYDPGQQRLFVDMVRRTQPDVILCPHPRDYHTDHRNVPELVLYTAPLIGLAEWPTEHPAWLGNPAVYFFANPGGSYFDPTHYVDISSVFETKVAMLKAHASQLDFLKRYFNMEALETLEIEGRFWGMQAGVRYAEPFIQYKGYGRGNLTIRHLP